MLDNDELFPTSAFEKQHEFIGSLSCGDSRIDNLQFFINYPFNRPGDIKCKILGTQETASEVGDLSNSSNQYMSLQAKTRYEYPYSMKIISNKVICQLITLRSEPENAQYIVAELFLEDITIFENYKMQPYNPFMASDLDENYICFFLSRSSSIWNLYWTINTSLTGNAKVSVSGSSLQLPKINDQLEAKIVPGFITQDVIQPSSLTSLSSLHMISIHYSSGTTNYDHDLLEKEAIKYIDNLLILTSFVSGYRMSWYGFVKRNSGSLKTYYKSLATDRQEEKRRETFIVPENKISDFLRQAMPKLRELMEKGLDASGIINYYLDGMEYNRGLDTRFTYLFWSLEIVKNYFVQEDNELGRIMNRSKFGRLEKSIMEQICKLDIDNIAKDAIRSKVNELNRYPMKKIIEKLLIRQGINIADLFSNPENQFDFVKTRNNIFHSNKPVQLGHLWEDYLRLKFILARIILSLLGWQDLSNAPDSQLIKSIRGYDD